MKNRIAFLSLILFMIPTTYEGYLIWQSKNIIVRYEQELHYAGCRQYKNFTRQDLKEMGIVETQCFKSPPTHTQTLPFLIEQYKYFSADGKL